VRNVLIRAPRQAGQQPEALSVPQMQRSASPDNGERGLVQQRTLLSFAFLAAVPVSDSSGLAAGVVGLPSASSTWHARAFDTADRPV
jgi:hypothetical protein